MLDRLQRAQVSEDSFEVFVGHVAENHQGIIELSFRAPTLPVAFQKLRPRRNS
jgi:hypothetical protein